MGEKIIVVGGGIGGLTAAALLANNGYDITVLEASNEWGGCAGKFNRKEFIFPVGATLGMGFEKDGIHKRVMNYLNKPVSYQQLDHIMDVHFESGEHIRVQQDRQAHLEALKSMFPKKSAAIETFYTKVWMISSEVRKLLRTLPSLPPSTFNEWAFLLQSLSPSSLKLLPFMNRTVLELLRSCTINENDLFSHYIDGQLIDSMQTTSKQCQSILGALALDIYHEGAFYVDGGLYVVAEQLAQHIEEKNGCLLKKKKVVHVKKQGNEWIVTDQKGQQWQGTHVIFNVPIHSLQKILEPTLFHQLPIRYKKKANLPTWGAFTMYFALKEDDYFEQLPLFQQVISKDHNMIDGDHIFLSLSKEGDTLRAPEGYRTLTVSTHTDTNKWFNMEKYKTNKLQLESKIIEKTKIAFPTIENQIILQLSGTPKTWERFTHRPEGMVGGFPQTTRDSLFYSLSHRSPLKNAWMCGDSIFPGAGTIGASISGYHVFRSITNYNIQL
ncbi:FAD-dependent oxidoreductase [Alkalihalobacterium sp. APHAB7]|uniref:FAD-dependent oxidoreductase n=1 Tax=Alkalihalobacterium sp. APHAB7 TaxID=3402081 RepID=UPI003AAC9BBA